MGLFGNQARRQAKRLTAPEWILWSYGVRVASDEAAVVSARALESQTPTDTAIQLHLACWMGAITEAAQWYSRGDVLAASSDPTTESQAVQMLRGCQLNATLVPPFPEGVIRQVDAHVRARRDPGFQRQHHIRRLQQDYAYLNANPAPLLDEAQRLTAIRDELAELGATHDPELNARVKRELGVEDTPFN